MLKKLRLKFVCFTMVLVTALLGVIFGMVYYFTSKSLETESIQMMQTLASNPFQLGRPGETQEEVRLPYFILQISQYGDLVATDSGYYDLSDQEFLKNVLTAALYADGQTGILKEYNLRFYRVTTLTAQRIVFADTSSERATLDHLVKTCLALGGISLLAFFGLSLLLARQMVKPIEQAWDQQRQFVADASHELKTPLTVILTNAELLQSPDCGGEEKARCADSILTMSHQMRGLVEGLLELARVDNGTAKMAFEELDLSQLVDDAVLPFEPLYFEQGLILNCQTEPGLRVKGSASHLRQVVDILLDNAQKYSTPQGEVNVELKRQGSHCLLSVSSPGEPISQADLKNIFKRFYRVDQARAMDHSYGLGLPIAQGIVDAHRGRIWAQSGQGRNIFFVQLPAA
jgi:signal transduction histidine kinase